MTRTEPLAATARPPRGRLPPAQRGLGHGHGHAAWVLGVASFALYLASAPVTSDALLLGNDVVPYAVELASGDRAALFDAHHLLFHPLAALLAPLVSLGARAGPVQAALLAQVLVSALGGALAVAAIARASGALAGARAAWVVGLLFATAIGNWLYASVGETYLPATAALAWLWGDALRARARGGSIGAVRLGALALLACLLRQDSVLALPWLVLVAPVRRVALGLSAAGAACLALYGVAWAASATTVSFVAWLRGLADTGAWGATPDGASAALAAVLTLAAHAWAIVPVALDISAGRGAGLELLLAAAPVLVVIAAVPWPGETRVRAGRGLGAAALALALFALARFAFFAWWQPSNLEYHAGTLLPLALLVAVGLAHGGARAPRLALAAVGAGIAAVGNWALLIGPSRASEVHARASAALAAASDDGAVVALDRLQHYAHLRARDGRAAPQLIDASVAVEGTSEAARTELAALLARLDAELAAGARIVLAIDLVTMERIGMPAPAVDAAAATALLSLGEAERRTDARGAVWLTVLER